MSRSEGTKRIEEIHLELIGSVSVLLTFEGKFKGLFLTVFVFCEMIFFIFLFFLFEWVVVENALTRRLRLRFQSA